MNTAEFLMIASSVLPDRTAMVCGQRSRTYAQMQDRVNRLANALQAMGVGKGDKISVMALNSMEYVEIYYSVARLGAAFVPLNYRAKRAEPAAENVDVLLVSVPFYHVAGATTMLSSVWGGRKTVVLPQFDPGAWLDAVQTHRVTHSFVVPTMLKRIMEHPNFAQTDLSSLKLVAYGAAPMPYEVVTRAVQAFQCGLMNAYGQTESTSSLTFLGPEDHQIPEGPREERERKLQRLRSVGRPMEDVVVMIMDPEGEILPPGQEGEIVAQGARVMAGYLGRGEETSEAMRGGWVHTGHGGWE